MFSRNSVALVLLACVVCVSATFNPRLKDLEEINDAELDAILADELELKFYTDCVLDKGSCDRSGRAIKETLADMRHTKDICKNCSAVQRRRAIKILTTLRSKPVYDEILRYYKLIL
ncbi:Insect odorant-binding protein A10/Ejaculatory bulb-specific protein 3 [Trinorchestia longiramus]|nr:Insect odorant-binding protein A10/Ejaculatory bulb-specific protein 3 [Trinorchestia longiramus]